MVNMRSPLNETIRDRFDAKAAKSDGCWKWTGVKNPAGYGLINPGGRAPPWLAHRVSWTIHVGPIPSGMCVLHRCDNPECTNPEHLFIGDYAANAADKVSKGRQHRGETSPSHKLVASQVIFIRGMYADGQVTQQDLADAFGVQRTAISDIINRKQWRHT